MQIENIYLSFGKKEWTDYKSIVNDRLDWNWNSNTRRDNFILGLFDEELNTRPKFDPSKAPHHRTLIIKSSKGYVEIRPDHSISGGWMIEKTYSEVDRVGENETMKVKRGEDIVYYLITQRN